MQDAVYHGLKFQGTSNPKAPEVFGSTPGRVGGLPGEAQMTVDPAILSGFRPRMMSVAYRMLGSVTDAEDAVQDAFVRLDGGVQQGA